jgi:hypothetical protein
MRATKLLPEETLLTKALDDFKQCADLDPAHDKAKRAKEKVEQASRRFTPQKTMEKYGPLVVVLLSLFIFGLGQYNFFTQSTGDFSAASYAILTFGSLLFLVAGLSLPQILKLKVGGLELEKSSMSPVTTPTRLGIYK